MKNLTAIAPVSAPSPINAVEALNFSDSCDAIVLSATPNTEATYTVPAGAKYLRLTSKDPFWWKFGASAIAVPAASTATGAAPALCVSPILIEVQNQTTLRLVSASISPLISVESWS